ncbi:hypothetical protein CEXT_764241 [Caerostris extrusa]|uniref:Uncharacterized protein n=1 Tax=Caerostris extrusa TaxID=172846 RepID=A0AAV4X718_CAEEX|nr:hypothetical protein CEXT_764241 [Caerostris extrusa]
MAMLASLGNSLYINRRNKLIWWLRLQTDFLPRTGLHSHEAISQPGPSIMTIDMCDVLVCLQLLCVAAQTIHALAARQAISWSLATLQCSCWLWRLQRSYGASVIR